MKKLLTYLVAFGLFFTVGIVDARSRIGYELQPYVGVDAAWRGLDIITPYTTVKYSFPQANLYTGIRFNDFCAMEVGGSLSVEKKAKPSCTTSDFHVGLVGFLPFHEAFEVIGGLGLSHLRHVFRTNEIKTSILKGIPRGLVGAQVWLCESVGIRTNLVFNDSKTLGRDKLRFKNKFHYSAGLQYQF